LSPESEFNGSEAVCFVERPYRHLKNAAQASMVQCALAEAQSVLVQSPLGRSVQECSRALGYQPNSFVSTFLRC
jgi:hypothetical protein